MPEPERPAADPAAPWVPLTPFEKARELLQRASLSWLMVFIGAVILGWWYLWPRSAPPPVESVLPTAAPAATVVAPTAAPVVVHVAGAVEAPGVYTLGSGARVIDAIDAAGGMAAVASPERVNLAAQLIDGSRVYVPREGEEVPAEVAVGPATAGADSGPIDLNTATAAELEDLPGIGPATAAAIITHREERGPFGAIEDLLDVSGIGPAKLDLLRNLVTV